MPSLRFFVSPRKRAIHTWTTKHPITSVIQNGSMILLLVGLGFRWSPMPSTHLRQSWHQVSTEIYRLDCHFSCVLLFLSRIFALLISRRSMLVKCQGANLPFDIQRMCRSRRNLRSCPYMVRASTFFVEYCLDFLCIYYKNSTSCLWDLFAAEASVKRERPFGTPVLRRSSKIRVDRKTLIHRCLLLWTDWVSILKPTDSYRFVWSPASFVAYPQKWEQWPFGAPAWKRVLRERGPLSDFWNAMCKEEINCMVPIQP